MNDEVARLRRLRKKVLKVRGLAVYLNAALRELNAAQREGGIYQRAAIVNWRIARIATGKLRSHPYWNYQKDPGFLESGAGRFSAYLMAALATIRGRGMSMLLEEISSASRELDDARALTLSAELSDALGRAQKSMRAVIDEMRDQVALNEVAVHQAAVEPGEQAQPAPSLSASPYLAL